MCFVKCKKQKKLSKKEKEELALRKQKILLSYAAKHLNDLKNLVK